jgi:hypothetical protein
MALMKSSNKSHAQSGTALRRAGVKNGTINPDDDPSEGVITLFEEIAVLGGALVFIGVGAEVLIFIWPPDNERLAAILANILVGIGVGLEVLFARLASLRQGILVQRSKDRLSEASDRLGELELEAGFAKESAAMAAERAARAELETERLRYLTAPRALQYQDIKAFSEALLGADPESVNISYLSGDAEAQLLAEQIAAALEAAKWAAFLTARTFAGAPTGINLWAKNGASDTTLRAAMTTAGLVYSEEGVPYSGLSSGRNDPSAPHALWIGPKPRFTAQ